MYIEYLVKWRYIKVFLQNSSARAISSLCEHKQGQKMYKPK